MTARAPLPLFALSLAVVFAAHVERAQATSITVTFSEIGVGDLAVATVDSALPGSRIGFWTASQITNFIEPLLNGVPIDPSSVVASWTDAPDPFTGATGQTWSAAGSVLKAEQNAFGARISDFSVPEPYSFETKFDPADHDNDYVGLIIGYLDDDSLIYILWGGTVGGRIVKKEGGVDTILAEDLTDPWAPSSDTVYRISVAVPEPGTFALVGFGLVGLAAATHRGRRLRS